MRKLVLATTSIVALAGVSVPALAQDSTPSPTWYYGIKAGLTRPLDADFDRNDNGNFAYRVDPKLGWAVLGNVGYDMGRIRLEAELGYHQSKVDSVWIADNSRASPPGVYDSPDGKTKLYTAMFNVLFDIVEFKGFAFSAGAGAGYGMVSMKNIAATDTAANFLDKADKEFMWQAVGGLSMPLSERVDLTADYRYLQTSKLDFIPENGDVKGRYKTHLFLVGARVKLGAAQEPAPEPAPPPPPPPPPAVEAPLMVFFEFDSARLTTDATRILDQAVEKFRQGSNPSILLEGHADRSGTDDYNLGLSKRRAEAVRNYLQRQGIPADNIAIEAYGESRPLVQTADGVREPQNRRVEIRTKQ